MTSLNQLFSLDNLHIEKVLLDQIEIFKVSPFSENELIEVVQLAHQNRWTIIPSGNASKLNWGGVVKNPQIILSTQKLTKIVEHAVLDFTVTVEAGLKLIDLQRELAKFGQFLPIDPAYLDKATLGGILSTADTGSYRTGYGSIRDLVLGVSWITSDGKVAKAGGKVVKNVAGYDLMKLFTGSYGTLGIISQITFRIYPLPQDSTTLVITGNLEQIIKLTKIISHSNLTPTMADLLSQNLLKRIDLKGNIALALRWQTITESIGVQIEQVKDSAQKLACYSIIYTQNEEAGFWQELKASIRHREKDFSILCKVGMQPSKISDFLLLIKELPVLAQIHLASGLGYLKLDRFVLLPQLRGYLEEAKGFLIVLEAPLSSKTTFEPWGFQRNVLDMMIQVKKEFDPLDILSPGRFFDKIK